MRINLAAIRAFDEHAVALSGDAVAAAAPSDLDRPTPCAGWQLRDLLAHMTAQHRGFAAAARGRGDERGIWDARAASEDPAGDYAAAAREVVAAFAGLREADAMLLPELAPAPFPAPVAVSFHCVDYAVHAWDVARSLGRPLTVSDDLAGVALEIALRVPDNEARRGPGTAFQRSLPARDDAPVFERVLTWLGRDPAWAPPQT
ncbi:MAG: TIGR03086 family metal-binding protein [Candidatus Dormiibacterota bacterium]